MYLCTQEAYSAVVEFFGENPKTFVPTSFFPLFVRFIKAYKVCVWYLLFTCMYLLCWLLTECVKHILWYMLLGEMG